MSDFALARHQAFLPSDPSDPRCAGELCHVLWRWLPGLTRAAVLAYLEAKGRTLETPKRDGLQPKSTGCERVHTRLILVGLPIFSTPSPYFSNPPYFFNPSALFFQPPLKIYFSNPPDHIFPTPRPFFSTP